MACNLTNEIIFKSELTTKDIHVFLNKANDIVCEFFNVDKKQLSNQFNSITVRGDSEKNPLIFNSLVNSLLKNERLGKEFITDIFIINVATKDCAIPLLKTFCTKYNVSFKWTKNYTSSFVQCLSLFLMILHFEKLIHLPFKFRIPSLNVKDSDTNKRRRKDLGIAYYPVMFNQIRSLDSQNSHDEESKFLTADNKEIIISYGSKLLLSIGWIHFEDVNIEDLLEFKILSEDKLGRFNTNPPYGLLISFLKAKNPNEFPISSNQWKNSSKLDTQQKSRALVAKYLIEKVDILQDSEQETNWGKLFASDFFTDKLTSLIEILPEYKNTIENWSIIQNSYTNKRKMESYKPIENALGYLNMYLFLALPAWYKKHTTSISYPQNPTDLKAGLFISRVLFDNKVKPLTLLEFLSQVQEQKELRNEYIYSIIKNLEKFFAFIETYAEELPNCKGFIQPISGLDYPKISRSMGTNKGLIPRNLFGALVNYIEVISQYNEIVNERILEEKINPEWLNQKFYSKQMINTIDIQAEIGFIPLIYINNEMIVLKDIPYVLDIKSTRLKDGRILKINYPHILNHISVILQTGIRGNHIQWLDAEKFDSLVQEDVNLFVPLYVNTDKSKTNSWTPIVHRKVIKTLKGQLKWRNIVDNSHFNEKKFYNDNPKTKWEKFYPLFSYTSEGMPYSDTNYSQIWIKILTFFQSLVGQSKLNFVQLAKLLPRGIHFNEYNMDVKLKEIGDKCDGFCELRWTSDITPHSARVSVVSNYITALPADIIGQYITGQTEAVVHHYVKLDPTYLTKLEKGQSEGLAKIAIQSEFDQLMGKGVTHPIFADKDGSNIAQSIAINKHETIAQYGCISINLKEDTRSGIDILIEESNVKMAFNKTEICPYNNNCPSDLIKELKGFRRCGVCPYAVRSIDHLPAIAVKKRQMMELLQEIENKLIEAGLNEDKYTFEELDGIEEDRQRITEELLGWIISEEMLEANRKRLQKEPNKHGYIVKKPEILIANLQQLSSKESDVQYLITRLADCESFPNLDTPMVRAKFDFLRRQLLAKLGDFQKAFDMKLPANPAQECLGLLKEVVNRYQLTHKQTVELLTTNMLSLQNDNKPLLELNYE